MKAALILGMISLCQSAPPPTEGQTDEEVRTLPHLAQLLSWPYVSKDLELLDNQSNLARRAMQQAMQEVGYQAACKNVEEDEDLDRADKREAIREAREALYKRSDEIIMETLLPRQQKRLNECFYWFHFNRRPIETLDEFAEIHRDTNHSLQQLEVAFHKELGKLLADHSVKLEQVYKKTLTPAELERLSEVVKVRVLQDPDDRQWYYEEIRPKMIEATATLQGEMEERANEIHTAYHQKLLSELTAEERNRWHTLAGERPELRTSWQTLAVVSRRFKYSRSLAGIPAP